MASEYTKDSLHELLGDKIISWNDLNNGFWGTNYAKYKDVKTRSSGPWGLMVEDNKKIKDDLILSIRLNHIDFYQNDPTIKLDISEIEIFKDFPLYFGAYEFANICKERIDAETKHEEDIIASQKHPSKISKWLDKNIFKQPSEDTIKRAEDKIKRLNACFKNQINYLCELKPQNDKIAILDVSKIYKTTYKRENEYIF